MQTVILKDHITNQLNDEEFFQFCIENRDLRIERNSNLEIVIMSPTSSLSGKINTEIIRQLSNWNVLKKTGEVFDSSTGFTLPDRSVFSPDASWVSSAKWSALTEEQKNSFSPVCPEFIIEIRSKSDSFQEMHNKMNKWIMNGCQLGWLIDPLNKEVHSYKPGQSPEIVYGFTQPVYANVPVEGFVLDLSFLIA